MLLDHQDLETYFSSIITLEDCLSKDKMRAETEVRLRPHVTLKDLPPIEDIVRIFNNANLPRSISEVDKLVYVTAIHHELSVITGDKALARAIVKQNSKVGNMAMVLKDLVLSNKISKQKCTTILNDLMNRKDFILPAKYPQKWSTLKEYKFL